VSVEIEFSLNLLVILALGAWIAIALNFARTALSSLLAFRALAVLDTFQSLLRSASWIAVAYFMPSALGLAVANLITAGGVSILGIALLWKSMGGSGSEYALAVGGLPHSRSVLPVKCMLQESFNFLWLRLATRVFQ